MGARSGSVVAVACIASLFGAAPLFADAGSGSAGSGTAPCRTIHLSTPLGSDVNGVGSDEWKHAVDGVGLVEAADPDLRAAVRVNTNEYTQDRELFIQQTTIVTLETRDGTVFTGSDHDVEPAFAQAWSALGFGAVAIDVVADVGSATVTVERPYFNSGSGAVHMACVPRGRKLTGRATAPGYADEPFETIVSGETVTVALHAAPVEQHEQEESGLSAAQILGFAFGAVLLFSLFGVAIWLTMRPPNPATGKRDDPPDFAMLIFRIIIAIGAGGVGGIFAGWLAVQVHITDSLAVDAVGGLAMFVIVFFYNPPVKINDRRRDAPDGDKSDQPAKADQAAKAAKDDKSDQADSG